MKQNYDPRHSARILALQKLFEQEFNKKELKNKKYEKFSEKSLCEINRIRKYDEKLLEKLVKAVVKSQEDIDKIISKLAPERPINEISQIDLQILRIAIAEGFIEKITPYKVAIDEAIELAKEFGGTASWKFVNGVLGSLLNKKEEFLKND